MSCGGTSTVAPKPSQTFKWAVQKVRCAGLVAQLARGWQGRADQHSGWRPSSPHRCPVAAQQNQGKLPVIPDDGRQAGTQIRVCSVTKMVQPKRNECRSLDLFNAIRSRMEAGPGDTRRHLGGESPTRRRHMRALQEGGGGGVVQERKLKLQERRTGWTSSSVDTEDSGLGDDSDSGEAKAEAEENLSKKQPDRRKVSRLFSLRLDASGGRRSSDGRQHSALLASCHLLPSVIRILTNQEPPKVDVFTSS